MVKVNKSWDEFHSDVMTLVPGIADFAPDMIVPCLRGAMVPATIIAEQLKTLEIYPMDIERLGTQRELAFLYMPKLSVLGKKILILEDDMYTAQGVLRAKEFFETQGAIVKLAAVYITKEAVKYADFYFKSFEFENMPNYPWKPTRNGDRLRSKDGTLMTFEERVARANDSQ